MDFSLTPEQEAFRERVRTWLKDNMPGEWTRRVMASSDVPRPEAYDFLRGWQRKLHEGGWAGISWPKEYGGRGATLIEQAIASEEMARAKVPRPARCTRIRPPA